MSADPSESHCAVCGEPVPSDQWHPAALEERPGDVRVRSFCSDGCRAAWTQSPTGAEPGDCTAVADD